MNNQTIFLSSTFKDMHAERDVIHNLVLPELDTSFRDYALNLDIVDLRWGVDTDNAEEDATAKILQVCFDEIDRSNPFFVCFIGSRYGWIPESELIKSSCFNAGLPSKAYVGNSITEMEIEYAVSRYENLNNCFFFFREGLSPEDISDERLRAVYFSDCPEDHAKIEALKNRLKTKYPDRTFSYNCHWDSKSECVAGLEELSSLLTEKLSKGLLARTNISVQTDDFERESAAQANHFALIAERTVDRHTYTDRLVDFALGKGEHREAAMVAESGLGKTSIMSCVTKRLEEENVLVLKLSAGLTQNSADFKFMIRYFYKKLATECGVPFEDGAYTVLQKKFSALLAEVAERKRIVIVIDALNQFSKCEQLKKLDWIHEMFIPENVRIIYSALPGQFDSVFERRGVKTIALETLNQEEISAISAKTAMRFHKQLSSDVVKLLATRKNSDGNLLCGIPLYLSMIVEYVAEFDIDDYKQIAELETLLGSGSKAINKYISEKILSAPESITELFGAITTNCERIVPMEAVRLITYLIEKSRFGIRQADIISIAQRLGINLTVSDFSLYRKRFRLHLVEREDGRWDFVHNLLRSAASEISAQENENRVHLVNRATADHFLSLSPEDELREHEVLYYLGLCRDYKAISNCILSKTNEVFGEIPRRELLNMWLSEKTESGRSFHAQALWENMSDEEESFCLCKTLITALSENAQAYSHSERLSVYLEVIDCLRSQVNSLTLPFLMNAYKEAGACIKPTNRKNAAVFFRIALELSKKISVLETVSLLSFLYEQYNNSEEKKIANSYAKKAARLRKKHQDLFGNSNQSEKCTNESTIRSILMQADKTSRKHSDEAINLYNKAISMLEIMIRENETVVLLGLYETAAERLAKIYMLRTDTHEKALSYSLLAQRLCRKLAILENDVRWNDKRLQLLHDASLYSTSDNNGNSESIKSAYNEAAQMSQRFEKSRSAQRTNPFMHLANNSVLLLLAILVPIWMVVWAYIEGSFTIDIFTNLFADMLQFVLGFLMVLPIAWSFNLSLETCKDTIKYRDGCKQRARSVLLYASVWYIAVLLAFWAKPEVFLEASGVRSVIFYYILNAGLVFTLVYFCVNIGFIIYRAISNWLSPVEWLQYNVQKRLHIRKFVRQEANKLALTALLPIPFYIAILTETETESLIYGDYYLNDVWKLHWLPLAIQGIISLVTILLMVPNFRLRVSTAKSLSSALIRKKRRAFLLRTVSTLLGITITFGGLFALLALNARETSLESQLVYQDFSYVRRTDGILISDYNGENSTVTIPTEIDGKPVVAIGVSAFAGKPIEVLELNENLKTIENGAFKNCIYLREVNSAESLTYIGTEAFYGCSSLSEMPHFPVLEDIGRSAFAYCTALTSYTIPNTLTSLPYYLFEGCTALTEAVIPDHVTLANNGLFKNCSNLKTVRIGKNLGALQQLFVGCDSLETVYFDAIDCDVFSHPYQGEYLTTLARCPSLKTIVIGAHITEDMSYLTKGCKNAVVVYEAN
ncbi:MAG: DUF4062 domain-containing protein [Ruminococcaceae bacterium]|nr:DUF4062 domain-containing protein [Oscillospiraceae bacterium]